MNQSENKEVVLPPLFVLSSATKTRFGVFSSDQRFLQLLETIQSIRKNCINSKIIILESGEGFFNDQELTVLNQNGISLVDYTSDANINKILKLQNWDIVKNLIEMYVFTKFYKTLSLQSPENKFSRVIKLSGRYILNNNFDLKKHINAKKLICLKGPFKSQFQPAVTEDVKGQYISRLYSFDPTNTVHIAELFSLMLENAICLTNSGKYIDIEHSLFKFIPTSNIKHLETLGVSGFLAPNGMKVDD